MKWNELTLEQSADLDHKIEIANNAILCAFAVCENPALSFSGGKDSTVLWDLIRRHPEAHGRSLAIVFGNTGMEFAESRAFVYDLAREWHTTIVEARPGHTDRPGLKYAAQRRVWQHLIDTGHIADVLKPDGKLKSTDALERACPADLYADFQTQNLIWPAGTAKVEYRKTVFLPPL